MKKEIKAKEKLNFSSDYMRGAHPLIMEQLVKTNMEKSAGYGLDEYSDIARDKIRMACNAPDADIFFLVGGTQTNATVIDALLKSYQGVISADTGHISVHEAGAIEFYGKKVIALPQKDGKINKDDIENCMNLYKKDKNRDHTVMPGMVYISQPTEYGTLYSLEELEEMSKVCRKHDLPLYIDGARLAYALACPENDVTLPDLARLCDAFYIGGTKCGTLFGEAVVFPKKNYIPHFFSIIKQHGALLAKGRISGIQFSTLFTDNLYTKIGKKAIDAANKIRKALIEKEYKLSINSPTNQIFISLSNEKIEELSEKVELGFIETIDENHSIMRIATSWDVQEDEVDKLIDIL